ncbi:MAG: deoxyribose-phosphate aldolase [Acetivibrionales bacterium]
MYTNIIDAVVNEVVEEALNNGNSNINSNSNILNQSAQSILKTHNIDMDYDRDMAALIEHSMIRPDATPDMVIKFCEEAVTYGFANVSLSPCFVQFAAGMLKGSGVKVSTAVAFPFGTATTSIKVMETLEVIEKGASEIDLPVNVGLLKYGDFKSVKHDIESVVDAAKGNAVIKVVVDLGLLTEEEKVRIGVIAKMAGAQYLKVAAGSRAEGVTVDDIKMMRQVVGSEMGIKADGGIKDHTSAAALIEAGANRIGASRSIKIVTGK